MRGAVITIVVLALVGATGYAWKNGGGPDALGLGWATAEASAAEVGTDAAGPTSDAPSADEQGETHGSGGSSDAGSVEPTTSSDPRRVASGSSKSVVYQWVDERGSVHFAGSLDDVPAAWRGRAGQIELDSSALSRTTAPPAEKSGSTRSTVAVAEPRPVHDVTVYTAPWCGWCRKTLAFLDERGVDYVNKDIEADVRWAEELREKTGGNAIPLVEIDGSRIPGFDPDQMASLLH